MSDENKARKTIEVLRNLYNGFMEKMRPKTMRNDISNFYGSKFPEVSHVTPTSTPSPIQTTVSTIPSTTPTIVPTPMPMPTDTKKTLTREEIANIYAEVTPSEYIPVVDKGNRNPARSYTDSQLALLRSRVGAYKEHGEYNQESITPREETEELLSLYCEKNGIQRHLSASAIPIENGTNIIETFTREPLFHVESTDGSPIDLNNIEGYPISNVSAAMVGYKILSSHKIAQSADVKGKY